MKRLMMLIVAFACMSAIALPVSAQDEMDGVKPKKVKKVKAPKTEKAEKVKKEKPPKPVLEEVSISGVIAKEEKKGKDDKVTVKYVLTDTEGNKIALPKPKQPKKGDGGAPAINLDDYLGASVTVVGQGIKTKKKDKEVVNIKTITSIQKAGGVADVEVFKDKDEEPEVEPVEDGGADDM